MTALQTATKLDVRPASGYTGAEIHGLDLRETLSEATVQAIRETLLKWKVVFFRDQQLGHAEHIAFARRFGKVTPSHPHVPGFSAEFPEILPIDSRRYPRGTVTYDRNWHSDVTHLVNPVAASILRAEIVPAYGGDTQWTNLVAAYEHLPEPLKDFANRLRVRHQFPDAFKNYKSIDDAIRRDPRASIHPLVRVHPETGERILFASPGFAGVAPEIIGFTPKQTQRLLDLFWQEITKPEYTVRFRWEAGSVAFWDNRSTCHLGPSDVTDPDAVRALYRVTLEGDVPVGVDGLPSESLSGEPFLGI